MALCAPENVNTHTNVFGFTVTSCGDVGCWPRKALTLLTTIVREEFVHYTKIECYKLYVVKFHELIT